MTALAIPSSNITKIIDDPTLLHSPASIGLSEATATDILFHGYTKGFSSLFIMNAALTAFATLVSVVMIKHKELMRGDEEALRQQAIREGLEKKMGKKVGPGSGAATPKESGATTARDLESGIPAAGDDDLEMDALSKKEAKDIETV